MKPLPRKVSRGEPVKAGDHNAILDILAENRLLVSDDIVPVTMPHGTSLVFKRREKKTDAAPSSDKPPFYVYAFSATAVKVTGGSIAHPAIGVGIVVVDSDELTVADGDKVWLERIDFDTWGFANGPSYPTDKLYVRLAVVAVASSVTVTRFWSGGNLSIPERFQCTLVSDGGSAGDSATACTFTYTATAECGVVLGEELEPEMSPARIYPWATVAATKGEVYLNAAGAFKLWSCNETQDMEWQANRVDPCDETFCAQVAACPEPE